MITNLPKYRENISEKNMFFISNYLCLKGKFNLTSGNAGRKQVKSKLRPERADYLVHKKPQRF